MAINVVLLFEEAAKLLLVMCGCLNYKVKKKPFISLGIFLVSVIYLIIRGGLEPEYQPILFTAVVIPIVALAVQGKRKVIFSIVSFSLICVLDDMVSLLLGKCFGISGIIEEDFAVKVMVTSVNFFVFAIVATVLQLLFYRRKRREYVPVQNVSGIYGIMIAVGVFTMCLLCVPLVSYDKEWTAWKLKFHSICCGIFGIAFLVIVVLLIYNNNLKLRYRYVAEANKRMYELQKNHYQGLREQDIETRKFRHDVKSHMVCIETLLKEDRYQEALEYLEKIKGKMEEITQRHKTGNSLVDAIVNDIAGDYSGVILEWEGVLPVQMNIPDTELCVIFSNLLKNAFCAANECKGKGLVGVRTGIISGALTVCIENNMERCVNEKDGEFITQKEDKENHGFGIMNVRECVAISGGSIEFDYTETQFKVQVVLPNIA